MKRVGFGIVSALFGLVIGCGACEQNRKEVAPLTSPTQEEKVDDTCFETCMKANQMRATSIEMIEADCRKSCEGNPKTLAP